MAYWFPVDQTGQCPSAPKPPNIGEDGIQDRGGARDCGLIRKYRIDPRCSVIGQDSATGSGSGVTARIGAGGGEL
jgi:hypothetical protein